MDTTIKTNLITQNPIFILENKNYQAFEKVDLLKI